MTSYSQEFQTSTNKNAKYGGFESEPRWEKIACTGPGRNFGAQLIPGKILRFLIHPLLFIKLLTHREMFIFFVFQPVEKSSFTITVAIEGVIHNVYVIKRPGCDEFMRKLAEHYEVWMNFFVPKNHRLCEVFLTYRTTPSVPRDERIPLIFFVSVSNRIFFALFIVRAADNLHSVFKQICRPFARHS